MKNQKQKHHKSYAGKVTRRIATKRKWLALAIAVTTGLSVICVADNLTANSFEPETVNAPVWHKYPEPEGKEKTELTVQDQIRLIAKDAGFEWTEYLVKLAACESKFDPYATNMNGGHSLDRGVFQINQKYHPEVSNECAFSVDCATKWTIGMIRNGQQKQWMCDKIIAKN
jgi:hypothetical protein